MNIQDLPFEGLDFKNLRGIYLSISAFAVLIRPFYVIIRPGY